TGKRIDHHRFALAVFRARDFEIAALLRYLDVQPTLRTQLFLDLSDCDRLITDNEDFALVASHRYEKADPTAKKSADQSQEQHSIHSVLSACGSAYREGKGDAGAGFACGVVVETRTTQTDIGSDI